MASNTTVLGDLHDEVHCPVCFELFVEPKALKACLHTVCGDCAQKLMRNGRIECPKCRKVSKEGEVVDDFRVKNLVEVYQKQSQNQNDVGIKVLETSICHLCEEKGQECYCNGCGRYLCSSCQKVHIKTTTCREGQSEKMTDKLQSIISCLDKQSNELKIENERFHKDSKQDVDKSNRVYSRCIKGIDDYEDRNVRRVQETCKKQRDKAIKWKNEHISTSAKRRDDLSSTVVQMMEHILAVKQATEVLKATHESLQEQINCELARFRSEKWQPLSLKLTNITTDAFHPESALKVIKTDDDDQASNSVCHQVTDLDLYKNFQLKELVSPGVGHMTHILDLLVFDNRLIALVQDEGNRKLVELDDGGHMVKIICKDLGKAWTATSSGGKIVVTTGDKGLLAVTRDGRVETITCGMYQG